MRLHRNNSVFLFFFHFDILSRFSFWIVIKQNVLSKRLFFWFVCLTIIILLESLHSPSHMRYQIAILCRVRRSLFSFAPRKTQFFQLDVKKLFCQIQLLYYCTVLHLSVTLLYFFMAKVNCSMVLLRSDLCYTMNVSTVSKSSMTFL